MAPKAPGGQEVPGSNPGSPTKSAGQRARLSASWRLLAIPANPGALQSSAPARARRPHIRCSLVAQLLHIDDGGPGYADSLVRIAVRPVLDTDNYIGRVTVVSRSRRPSPQVIRVLQALAADPAKWRYGYDLATEVHLKSGSLYPILIRLADREVLETSWEPGPPGRPPRHLYRLTPTGREYVATLDAAPTERSVPRRRLGLSGA